MGRLCLWGGQLSSILAAKYGRNLLNYDKYMGKENSYLKNEDMIPRTFDFVITTSVFEHFTKKKHFAAVESLVGKTGVFGIHTVVCEEIPQDPQWFYYTPIVHCSFFTNKAMSILFNQWGYSSSIYNVNSRLWLWFKEPPLNIKEQLEVANAREQGPTYIYKDGFVDYWK